MRYHLKIMCLLGGALIAGCATTPEIKTSSSQAEVSSELINRSEVVAVVKSVDTAIDLEQQAARWGYDLKRKEELEGLGLYLLTFDCPPGIDPEVASAELERLQPKSTVQANHKFTLQTTKASLDVKPLWNPREYANTLIEWPEDGCEALVKIGIIDGDVDVTASGLKAADIRAKDFISGKNANGAEKHGTAIAQLLVGPGRLKKAELYAASVVELDDDGVAYSGVEPMLKALDWMVKSDVRVVNVSLAGPYNTTLERGIASAAEKGLIIVAAAGNDGAHSKPRYPAALNEVIAATAIDKDLNIYIKAVQGQHIDVAAPGVEVFVGDRQTGRYVSGTSIAAPFVAAKIAADVRYKAMMSIEDTRRLLTQKTLDLGENGRDSIFGAGLIKTNGSCKT